MMPAQRRCGFVIYIAAHPEAGPVIGGIVLPDTGGRGDAVRILVVRVLLERGRHARFIHYRCFDGPVANVQRQIVCRVQERRIVRLRGVRKVGEVVELGLRHVAIGVHRLVDLSGHRVGCPRIDGGREPCQVVVAGGALRPRVTRDARWLRVAALRERTRQAIDRRTRLHIVEVPNFRGLGCAVDERASDVELIRPAARAGQRIDSFTDGGVPLQIAIHHFPYRRLAVSRRGILPAQVPAQRQRHLLQLARPSRVISEGSSQIGGVVRCRSQHPDPAEGLA